MTTNENKKISQLPELFDPSPVDQITIVDTSESEATLRNKKVSLNTLSNFFEITSPLTAKGDLWTYDTDNTILPIGTDGQLLSVNSATSTGLEWIDAPLGSGEPYINIVSTGTLPVNTGSNTIAIGPLSNVGGLNTIAIGTAASTAEFSAITVGTNASSVGEYGIAIGHNAQVGDPLGSLPNSNEAMAFGRDAIALQANAVQLGPGTNNTTSTLQFLTNTIATENGVVVPYQTTGVAPTSTPVDGTLVLDNNGGTTTLWARANGAWVSLISV